MAGTKATSHTGSRDGWGTPHCPTSAGGGPRANPEPEAGHAAPCRLRLRPELRARLGAMVCAGYPEETCGLLLGRRNEDLVEVLELVQARNLNRERARDRYELDPDAFLAADTQARARGREVVGVWHSHPDHPARPSATDRARAWPDWSYVIASVNPTGLQELRSWRLHDGDFIEEVVE